MNKKARQAVYDKCGGHCGYCGRVIEITAMQVDHMLPLRRIVSPELAEWVKSTDNLMPACRSCNHYKRNSTVEEFRASMITLHERIHETYIVKVAKTFGMFDEVRPFGGLFYFEYDTDCKIRRTFPRI